MVAENVVRRLSDHRYHGGILRLEFSAGVAVADPGEPVDAPGADPARGPGAERGQARQRGQRARRGRGARTWSSARSLDRLQGIFTGDKSKDYRNMRLLLDSVAVVAASTDPAELARSFTERLFETLHARRVGVLERSRERRASSSSGGSSAGREPRGPSAVTERDLAVVERACREGNFVAEGGEEPGELSLCALPLFLQEPLPGRHRARGGVRSASPSRARTGGSWTPWPPRWRWPSTGPGSSGASASGSGRRRSAWRPRSRTCGAWCTAPGSPTAPRPWSRCSPPRARWRARTPPSSSPARAAPARRCWPTPSTS